jgi:hypothetical protein
VSSLKDGAVITTTGSEAKGACATAAMLFPDFLGAGLQPVEIVRGLAPQKRQPLMRPMHKPTSRLAGRHFVSCTPKDFR